jgi:hypothetical protein
MFLVSWHLYSPDLFSHLFFDVSVLVLLHEVVHRLYGRAILDREYPAVVFPSTEFCHDTRKFEITSNFASDMARFW